MDQPTERSTAGSTRSLVSAATFSSAACSPMSRNMDKADYLARWTGSGWAAPGSKSPTGALKDGVRALALAGTELFVGGFYLDADGNPTADGIAAFGPITAYQPDGRIKKGSGTQLGTGVYGIDGAGQTVQVRRRWAPRSRHGQHQERRHGSRQVQGKGHRDRRHRLHDQVLLGRDRDHQRGRGRHLHDVQCQRRHRRRHHRPGHRHQRRRDRFVGLAGW